MKRNLVGGVLGWPASGTLIQLISTQYNEKYYSADYIVKFLQL